LGEVTLVDVEVAVISQSRHGSRRKTFGCKPL
jgi:hypothetical protein